MSLFDSFNERLEAVTFDGFELQVYLQCMINMLESILLDPEEAERQRMERVKLRAAHSSCPPDMNHMTPAEAVTVPGLGGEVEAPAQSASVDAPEKDSATPDDASAVLRGKGSTGEEDEDDGADAVTREVLIRVSERLFPLLDDDRTSFLLFFICVATRFCLGVANFAALRLFRVSLAEKRLQRRRQRRFERHQRVKQQQEEQEGEAYQQAQRKKAREEDLQDRADVEGRKFDFLLGIHQTIKMTFAQVYIRVRLSSPDAELRSVVLNYVKGVTSALQDWRTEPKDMLEEYRHSRGEQLKHFLMRLKEHRGNLGEAMMIVGERRRQSASQCSGDSAMMESARSAIDDEEEAAVATQSSERRQSGVDEAAEASSEAPSPNTVVQVARALDEFMESRDPAATELAAMVSAIRPDLGVSALLPGELNVDRHTFFGAASRLAPYCADEEVVRVFRWLKVDDTAAVVREVERLDAAEGGEAASGLCNDDCGDCEEDGVSELDEEVKTLTLLDVSGVRRLRLSNPLLPCKDVVSGYRCDCCCRPNVEVAFQAVIFGDVRTDKSNVEGCVGFDMCAACVVYLWKKAFVRLAISLHPDAKVRRPFECGLHSGLKVWSVATTVLPFEAKGEEGGCEAEGGVRHTEEVVQVKALLGVSPYEARPQAWCLTTEDCASMEAAFSDGMALLQPYVPLLDGQPEALPIPRVHAAAAGTAGDAIAKWTERGTSVTTRTYPELERIGATDQCPICLEPLTGPNPAIRTVCGHWFHIECIEHTQHQNAESGVEACPLCRRENFMPTNDLETVLHSNLYTITLTFRRPRGVEGDEVQRPAHIAFGAFTSEDGLYHNPTNVSACRVLTVVPGQLQCYEEDRANA